MRSVVELENGNIPLSNDTDLIKIDTNTNLHSTLYSNGGFQYLTKATLPNLGIKPIVKSTVKLYPNPTINKIKIDSHFSIQSLQVYSLEGKVVLTQQPNTNTLELNVEQHPTGTYVIKLQAEKNTTSHKFIKQ